MSIINKLYSGKKSLNYEKNRSNQKWKFEQENVELFLKKNQDIYSILDAPIGTNRFGKIIDKLNNIKIFHGLDLSDDMLLQSKKKNTKKLYIKKHNIINQKIELNFDILIMIRFLNLIPQKDFINTLENILPNINKYFILTLRHDKKLQFIENKIYIQDFLIFKNIVKKYQFKISSLEYKDNKLGTFSIFFGEKC